MARIIVDESDGVSLGSGTLVDVRRNFGLVVTNWHVIRDAEGPVRVVFPDGFSSAARILKVDRDWDLAALMIWRPNAAPVPLASVAPRPGEPLTIAGYGSGDYRAVSGSCTQYLAPSHQHPYEMVELSASARQGDSGGPIFNTRGQLAGVLFGSGGGTTSGSYAGRVGQFLATAWPPPDAETRAALADRPPTTSSHDPHQAAVKAGDLQQLPAMPAKTPLLPLPGKKSSTEVATSPVGPEDSPNAGPEIPTAGPPDRTPPAAGTFDWKSIAGPTRWDQFKTILAAIGALAIFLKFTRRRQAE